MDSLQLVDIGRKVLPLEGNSCALHTYHRPEPTYFEEHHVVPQSWTNHYYFLNLLSDPANDILLGMKKALCRTGHGNVHFYMVKLTTKIAKASLTLDEAWTNLNSGDRAARMAYDGIRIANNYGMNVGDLYKEGLRGQI